MNTTCDLSINTLKNELVSLFQADQNFFIREDYLIDNIFSYTQELIRLRQLSGCKSKLVGKLLWKKSVAEHESLFVNRKKPMRSLLEDNAILLLSHNTGSGKTTLVKELSVNINTHPEKLNIKKPEILFECNRASIKMDFKESVLNTSEKDINKIEEEDVTVNSVSSNKLRKNDETLVGTKQIITGLNRNNVATLYDKLNTLAIFLEQVIANDDFTEIIMDIFQEYIYYSSNTHTELSVIETEFSTSISHKQFPYIQTLTENIFVSDLLVNKVNDVINYTSLLSEALLPPEESLDTQDAVNIYELVNAIESFLGIVVTYKDVNNRKQMGLINDKLGIVNSSNIIKNTFLLKKSIVDLISIHNTYNCFSYLNTLLLSSDKKDLNRLLSNLRLNMFSAYDHNTLYDFFNIGIKNEFLNDVYNNEEPQGKFYFVNILADLVLVSTQEHDVFCEKAICADSDVSVHDIIQSAKKSFSKKDKPVHHSNMEFFLETHRDDKRSAYWNDFVHLTGKAYKEKLETHKKLAKIFKEIDEEDSSENSHLSDLNVLKTSSIKKTSYTELLYTLNELLTLSTTISNIFNKHFYNKSVIILDEVHLLFNDSFETVSNKILSIINLFFNIRPVIMLSSTPSTIKTYLDISNTTIIEVVSKNDYYTSLFEYVTFVPYNRRKDVFSAFQNMKMTVKHKSENSPEKTIIASNNLELLNNVCKEVIQNKYGYGADSSDIIEFSSDKKYTSEFKDFMNNKKFPSKFLLTTSVLTTGSNIIDPDLKRILTDFTSLDDLIQLVGRHRFRENKIELHFANKINIKSIIKSLINRLEYIYSLNQRIHSDQCKTLPIDSYDQINMKTTNQKVVKSNYVDVQHLGTLSTDTMNKNLLLAAYKSELNESSNQNAELVPSTNRVKKVSEKILNSKEKPEGFSLIKPISSNNVQKLSTKFNSERVLSLPHSKVLIKTNEYIKSINEVTKFQSYFCNFDFEISRNLVASDAYTNVIELLDSSEAYLSKNPNLIQLVKGKVADIGYGGSLAAASEDHLYNKLDRKTKKVKYNFYIRGAVLKQLFAKLDLSSAYNQTSVNSKKDSYSHKKVINELVSIYVYGNSCEKVKNLNILEMITILITLLNGTVEKEITKLSLLSETFRVIYEEEKNSPNSLYNETEAYNSYYMFVSNMNPNIDSVVMFNMHRFLRGSLKEQLNHLTTLSTTLSKKGFLEETDVEYNLLNPLECNLEDIGTITSDDIDMYITYTEKLLDSFHKYFKSLIKGIFDRNLENLLYKTEEMHKILKFEKRKLELEVKDIFREDVFDVNNYNDIKVIPLEGTLAERYSSAGSVIDWMIHEVFESIPISKVDQLAEKISEIYHSIYGVSEEDSITETTYNTSLNIEKHIVTKQEKTIPKKKVNIRKK